MFLENYGVLAQVVATAGSLVAAGGALLLTWKGRFKWEPTGQDIPSGAQKAGGLIIAVMIATFWYKVSIAKTLGADDLIQRSWECAAGMLAGLIGYTFLIGVYVYYRAIGTGSAENKGRENIIGGFWLRRIAKEKLKADPTCTTQELLKRENYDVDLVWSRPSRASAKAMFQLAYIALIGFGTLAMAAISLLIALSSEYVETTERYVSPVQAGWSLGFSDPYPLCTPDKPEGWSILEVVDFHLESDTERNTCARFTTCTGQQQDTPRRVCRITQVQGHNEQPTRFEGWGKMQSVLIVKWRHPK